MFRAILHEIVHIKHELKTLTGFQAQLTKNIKVHSQSGARDHQEQIENLLPLKAVADVEGIEKCLENTEVKKQMVRT